MRRSRRGDSSSPPSTSDSSRWSSSAWGRRSSPSSRGAPREEASRVTVPGQHPEDRPDPPLDGPRPSPRPLDSGAAPEADRGGRGQPRRGARELPSASKRDRGSARGDSRSSEFDDFRGGVLSEVSAGRRLVSLFGDAPSGAQQVRIFAVLADDREGVAPRGEDAALRRRLSGAHARSARRRTSSSGRSPSSSA